MALDPGTPVLIFDGRCGFCSWSVEWLRPRFSVSVHLVPYQAIDPRQYGLTLDEVRASVWWLDAGHARHAGAAAIAQSLIACRPPWPHLGRLLGLPVLRTLAAIGYAVIARLRAHLPGTSPAWPRGATAQGITTPASRRP